MIRDGKVFSSQPLSALKGDRAKELRRQGEAKGGGVLGSPVVQPGAPKSTPLLWFRLLLVLIRTSGDPRPSFHNRGFSSENGWNPIGICIEKIVQWLFYLSFFVVSSLLNQDPLLITDKNLCRRLGKHTWRMNGLKIAIDAGHCILLMTISRGSYPAWSWLLIYKTVCVLRFFAAVQPWIYLIYSWNMAQQSTLLFHIACYSKNFFAFCPRVPYYFFIQFILWYSFSTESLI